MGVYYQAKNNVKTEYHCGECSQPFGNDDELWIGCDEQRNGRYHAVCVCMEEGSLQTISIRCVYSTGTGTPKNRACSTGTGVGALFGAWMAWIPAGEIEMK